MTHPPLPAGELSPRARAFLAAEARREPFAPDRAEDAAEAAEACRLFGTPAAEVLAALARMRADLAGLRYRSRSQTFEEVVTFAPALDVDADDAEGFRLHVWETLALLLSRPSAARWQLRVQTPDGVHQAERFLSAAHAHPGRA